MILLLLALFTLSVPAMAEGELEMFEEICEITGEVRTGIRLKDINLSRLQTSNPTSSQSMQARQNTF